MYKIFSIAFVFSFLSAGNVFSLGNQENVPADEIVLQENQSQTVNQAQTRTEPDRAELVMNALAQAYPQQIEKAEYRNNDWAVLLRGKWYFFAGGRILPQELTANAASYSPQPFYNYQAELPAWRKPTPEEAERYGNMSRSRNQNPLRRSPHFFDDLWRAHNNAESYERVKTLRFLGHSVTVHNMILENLSLVEEEILAASRRDSQVQAWINNISSLEGWAWRNIAETQSRSYHSYGLALDFIPKSLGGKQTYWLWTSQYRNDWWNVSYNERHHPPSAVIKAFEKYGFIWGGKWLYFDTMHFEYRPEILILSGMPPETRR
ncbi:MAG: M15 family metallopeptidase [Treponema sp.]|nr:M15 family metallopeptidase [Treponema sp.]